MLLTNSNEFQSLFATAYDLFLVVYQFASVLMGATLLNIALGRRRRASRAA